MLEPWALTTIVTGRRSRRRRAIVVACPRDAGHCLPVIGSLESCQSKVVAGEVSVPYVFQTALDRTLIESLHKSHCSIE